MDWLCKGEMSDRSYGLLQACIGIVILSPDTLLIRAAGDAPNNELTFWRMFLAFIVLVAMSTYGTWKRMREEKISLGQLATSEEKAEANEATAVVDSNDVETEIYTKVETTAEVDMINLSNDDELNLFWTMVNKFTTLNRWFWLAGIVYGIANLCFVIAAHNTYISSMLVVIATSSIFANIISYFLLNEPMLIHTWVCSFVCVGAIILVFAKTLFGDGEESNEEDEIKFTSQQQTIGMLCALCVAIGSGLYYTILRYISQSTSTSTSTSDKKEEIDLIPVNIISMFFVSFITLFFKDNGVTNGESYMATGQFPIIHLFLQGLVVIPLSFTFLANASRRIKSAEIGMIMTFETIVGPIWVSLAGYDKPPALSVYGGIIIVISLLSHEYINLQIQKENDKLNIMNNDNNDNGNLELVEFVKGKYTDTDTKTAVAATIAYDDTINKGDDCNVKVEV
jgi:drug/metabolite transporter (DMT)-like permease